MADDKNNQGATARRPEGDARDERYFLNQQPRPQNRLPSSEVQRTRTNNRSSVNEPTIEKRPNPVTQKVNSPEEESNLTLDTLIQVNAQERRANYVFTVGRSGSGKSTLQSWLLRHVSESREYSTRTIREANGPREPRLLSEEVMSEWHQQWSKNELPHRTQVGRPAEFRFEVTPMTRPNAPLSFGFFEASGEDFQHVMRSGIADPKLPVSLRQFLSNEHCRFVFLLVCIGHDMQGDDRLFCDFVEYLHDEFDGRFWNDSSIAIVIADPTSANRLLKTRGPQSDTEPSTDFDIDEFSWTFLQKTRNKLQRWSKPVGLAPFSIGKVYQDPSTDAKYVEDFSQQDADSLFRWIYRQFIGFDPGPQRTATSRLLEILERLG